MDVKYVINGKFLSQKMTGVQRFAREIVRALDDTEWAKMYELAIPQNAQDDLGLKNIVVKKIGINKGILWEQLDFPLYLFVKGRIGINLGNVAPLIKPDCVCIHDMIVIKYPDWFSRVYCIWMRLLYFNTFHRAKKLFTVSEFSRHEIQKYYPFYDKDIVVLSEGWQHMESLSYENEFEILKKFQLKKNEYMFSNYQLAPYKNFDWVIEVSKRNTDVLFVVTGWKNKIVHKDFDVIIPQNVMMLGYVSDLELKVLLKNCKAFIFPSFYEGFGLPPIEALAMGVNVIVSDIPTTREILDDSVVYINPREYNVDLHRIEFPLKENRQKVLEKYSWRKGAITLSNTLCR